MVIRMNLSHKNLANAIRFLSVDAVQKANSGHPGMPMGMADVATVLFKHFLKFDPSRPYWPDRDRFILSAGHGSMLLYAILYRFQLSFLPLLIDKFIFSLAHKKFSIQSHMKMVMDLHSYSDKILLFFAH